MSTSKIIKLSIIGLVGIVVLGVVGGGVYLATGTNKVVRYQPTGMNNKFYGDGMTFQQYITDTRNRIATARQKAGTVHEKPHLENAIVGLLSPFEWHPKTLAPDQKGKKTKYRNGVLMMHGLNASPYEMRSLAKHFLDRGFMVRATLMPGHGTVPGDLTNVSYEEWKKMAEYGIESFKGEVENLYLFGFSTGGALASLKALEQAEKGDDRIKGIILSSPALSIRTSFAFLANFANSLSSIFPSIKMLVKKDDKAYFDYESFSVNGGAQIYNLVQEFKAKRAEVDLKVPVFSISSMSDHAVAVKDVKDFLYGINNEKNRHILFAPEPVDMPESVAVIRQVNSNQKAWGGRVIGYSHGALHVSPDDFYYGRYGQYKFCGHYDNGSDNYKACLAGNRYLTKEMPSCGRYLQDSVKREQCEKSKAYMGSPTSENLSNYKPLQQLSFNTSYRYIGGELDWYLYENNAIDPDRFQFYEYNRQKTSQQAADQIRQLLWSTYSHGDLKSTLEEVSLFQDMKLLRELKLRHTRVLDLSPLAQLINLRILTLGDVDAVGPKAARYARAPEMSKHVFVNFDTLGELENLEELKIYGVGIEDISVFKKMKKLKNLLLDNTGLTREQYEDIKDMLPECKVIYMNQIYSSLGLFKNAMDKSGHDVMKALTSLATTMDLQKINFVQISGTKVKNIQAIKHLKNLTSFSLDNVQIESIDPLLELEHLEDVSLAFVKHPGGNTQTLIDRMREKFPKIKTSTSISTMTTLPKLTVSLMRKPTLSEFVDYIEQDVNLREISGLSLDGKSLEPVTSLAPLAKLTGSKFLSISNVDVGNLVDVKTLEKLETLVLSNLPKLRSIEGIEGMASLKMFFITGGNVGTNLVSDLSPLKGLENMERLSFVGMPIQSIAPLENMKKLKILSLSFAPLSDLSPLKNMTSLTQLDIPNTQVSDLSPLVNLTLAQLNCTRTKVSDIRPVLLHRRNAVMRFDETPFAAKAKRFK